ncbi:alpha/beta hydrolase [Haloplanus salilacus]|uniref:alpha/beta hydrolase n=1 Tax=Haloplanus salilacus TaxID=2949994 RepID=UPI0030CBDFA2
MATTSATRRRSGRFDFATTTLSFESEGTRCRGHLYRPDRPATPPVVVLAPDLAAEATFGYTRYAERFARAGYAALALDYRGFGGSDGTRPAAIDPPAQAADLDAAVDRVRRLDGERRRVVLWGHGLGGGHALATAAASRRVSAVVAVAPLLDGRAFARRRSLGYLTRALRAGGRDRLLAPLGRSTTVPVVGGPREFGLLPRSRTGEAYLDLVPRGSDWANATPARGLLALFRYRPITTLDDVNCPTLVVAAGADDLVASETAATAADRIDGSTLVRLPVGHVDPLGDAFETAAAHQVTFLDGAVGR